MSKLVVPSIAVGLIFCAVALAQTPVIVQPANQTVPTQAKAPAAAADESELLPAIKSLEELKTANDEMLKRQQATLDLLDQLQKDADQLRIYAKRG